MHNYTIVAYKPDSNDYCRGCHMASYSSDHVLFCSQDPNEIAEKWVVLEATDLSINECGYEITILIDGIRYDCASEYTEDDQQQSRDQAYLDLEKLKNEAFDKRTAAALAKQESDARAAKEQKETKEAEEKVLKKEADRVEYERLKKIFAVG